MSCLKLIGMGVLFASTLFAGEDSSYLTYSIGDNRVSVVYVMQEEVSDAEAKQKALMKGSEILCPKGYEYFGLVSEGKVTVIQMPSRERNDDVYSGQGARSLVEQNAPLSKPSVDNSPENYSGYKVVLQGYKDKPSGASFRCPYTQE